MLKVKDVYSFSFKPVSELLSITCHTESHSVTCHPTQVNVPQLDRLVLDLFNLEG